MPTTCGQTNWWGGPLSCDILKSIVCGRHKRRGRERKGEKRRTHAIRITPTDFLVIGLCELSILATLRNWCVLLRKARIRQSEVCGRQRLQKLIKGGLYCRRPLPLWCLLQGYKSITAVKKSHCEENITSGAYCYHSKRHKLIEGETVWNIVFLKLCPKFIVV